MNAPAKLRQTMVFVCLVLFCDAMGLGLVVPVLPKLIAQLSQLSNSASAGVSGQLLFVYAAMQFVCAPLWGALSDRFGRRPILLGSLLGFSLNYFLMAWAPTLGFLFLGRIISGIFGSTYAAANAAIADIAAPDQRARLFGLAGAAIGLGFILGPALGGFLGAAEARLPFLVAGLLSLGACSYGWLRFVEAPRPGRKFSWARANPFGALAALGRSPALLLLLAGVFCIHLSQQSYVSIWAFYTIEVAHWSVLAIGATTALYGLMMVLVQGFLVAPAIKSLGEHTTLRVGIAMGALSYLVLAFASGPTAIIAALLVGGFSQLGLPAAQALMSRHAPADAQGELQGAVAISVSVACVSGPVVMTPIFSAFTDTAGSHWPGAPFALAAALLVIAAVVFTLAQRRDLFSRRAFAVPAEGELS